LIKKKQQEVWHPTILPAAKSWNAKLLNFGCLISKKSNHISQKTILYDGAEIATKYFM